MSHAILSSLHSSAIPAQQDELTLPVIGMTCATCAGRIEQALRKHAFVHDANVNLATEKAHIHFDHAAAKAFDIARIIEDSGYQIGTSHVRLAISGMTCATCSGRVEKALRQLAGVVEAQVNLVSEHADVVFMTGVLSAADLILAVEDAGYGAQVMRQDAAQDKAQDEHMRAQTRREFIRLIIAFCFTLPLLLPMLDLPLPLWLQWALATPVQFYFGARFYKAAWSALKHFIGSMDVLVALGTSVAYAYSLWLILQPHIHHTYFEASTFIITLVMCGKYIEQRTKASTTSTIRALMALRPDVAHVVRGTYEMDVPIEALNIGDVVLVRPGEKIPIDGVVRAGSGFVDESLLTGESMPVHKQINDRVSAGALNGMAALQIETSAIGDETTLARIIHLVEHAQMRKAPVQKLVDRVASLFVPVVLVCAAVSFAAWLWITHDISPAILAAVSVTVIACPCALGLATPTAFMVGTGVAARAGILVRDQEALERAHLITTVVMDKTGTLTQGRLDVAAIETSADINVADALSIAASLQQSSEHPVGRAVVAYTQQHHAAALRPVRNFMAHAGRGVSAQIDDIDYVMGNRRFLSDMGFDVSALDLKAQDYERRGHTVIFMANRSSQKVMGLMALRDQIKDTTPEALRLLRTMGLHLVMLTGDNERTAKAIAHEIGIDDVRAGILPEGKADVIASLRTQGHIIAMIGDGVNDAPALALADIGMAMGTGTDVAMHSASITLMRGDPRMIVDALDISRATYRTIQRGLFWAFIYNVIGIPIAAFGMLNPMFAGAAMACSSLSVVLNALLLRRWRPRAQS